MAVVPTLGGGFATRVWFSRRILDDAKVALESDVGSTSSHALRWKAGWRR